MTEPLRAVRERVREHRHGMGTDLAFAVVWVTVVSVLFGALGAPEWATQIAMLCGVVAYFGFFASLSAARRD